MTRIGLISDTHGLMRPEALGALAGVAHILHAGDIGSAEILSQLRTIAPVTAVRGNNDKGAWAAGIAENEVLVIEGKSIYVLHDIADLDLDASTAIRFHFAELALSAPWRAAQVRLIGVRPEVLHAWQDMVLAMIIFHHSNLRLPAWCERLLSAVIVTPRLHGIHHSSRGDEMNSNWSSGLAVWDTLHGTRRTDVAQDTLRIGVEGYTASEVTLSRLLTMPFAAAHARVRTAVPPPSGVTSTSR